MKFARVSSTTVLFNAHVREDSRFAILPVMNPSSIRGWAVYDADKGEIVGKKDDLPFRTLNEAKTWLEKEYPT